MGPYRVTILPCLSVSSWGFAYAQAMGRARDQVSAGCPGPVPAAASKWTPNPSPGSVASRRYQAALQ